MTILIAIKPERILEPFAERCSVGGMSLTLSIVHTVSPGDLFSGGTDSSPSLVQCVGMGTSIHCVVIGIPNPNPLLLL
jgi:hypothetical protein